MRSSITASIGVFALILLPTSAAADPANYGIESVEASVSTAQAGAHPDFTTTLTLKREANNELPATTRDAIFELPPGLTGNPMAVPTCSLARFVATDVNDKSNATGCPQASQVGITEIELFNNGGTQRLSEPVYNLEPGAGEPARLGFFGKSFPVVLDARLRSDTDYGVTVAAEGISSLIPLLTATTTIWAVPADESHDAQRITAYEALHNGGAPETPNGKRSSGLALKPFMVNPVQCGVPQGVNVATVSYSLPDLRFEAFAPLPPNTSCGLLDFSPELSTAPTTSSAETGSGLDVELHFPSDAFENPSIPGEDIPKRVELLLPEGLTVNPSQATGLGACSEGEYANERFGSAPGEGCPEDSKIGTVSAKSPLLNETAQGSIFVATPHRNPFGTLIALYMVVKIPERGVIVKLPIRIDADPATGRLRSVVDGIPQLPVSSFSLHFRAGPRSPLVTPSRCGTYLAAASFTSWGGHSKTVQPSFQIASGLGGGPCSTGPTTFAPTLSAGSLDNTAGAYTPFYMRIHREDGEPELSRLAATLPRGLLAKLAGVARCADASIQAARSRSGAQELSASSCPAGSTIGHLIAGAGVGSSLTFVGGDLYLAGPYLGAPLSVAAIVPAVAGPFDLGTVVTRLPLRLNPRTGVVTAGGEDGDALPHILAGIPLRVRDVRVHIDRPRFALNPTSCDPLRTTARIWGSDASGEVMASPVARFQAGDCARLGFAPRLSLLLKGGTKRGDHPALRGVFRPRRGDANLAGVVLRLPHSAFLEQSHIRTICTRVQYAAHRCPKGAVYGHARAITPLLEEPLVGPVYLRSSNHRLPDLVASLHGLVDVEAVARIDSVDGGLRATFTKLPDAPLTKVVVSMQGGEKGLVVNSTNLCAGPRRATAELLAHNDRQNTLRPELRAAGCAGNSNQPDHQSHREEPH